MENRIAKIDGLRTTIFSFFKLTPQHLLILALFISLYFRRDLTVFFDDPGVGWHLANGEWILKNRAIPYVDYFLAPLFTGQREWISDQWLSDLVLWLLYKWGGWNLSGLFLTALYFGAFLLIPHSFLRREYGPFAVAAACFLAFRAAEIHFIFRPVVFSFFFFSLTIFWLISCRIRDKGAPGIATTTSFAILYCIWANSHPGFILGLIFQGLNLFALLLESAFKKQKNLSAFFIIFLVSCSATLINPYFLKLHKSIIALGSSDYFMTLHAEWLPIELSSTEGRIFILCTALVIMSGVYSLWGKTSLELHCLISSAFLAIATLKSVRFLPFFGLSALTIMACFFSDIGGKIHGIYSRRASTLPYGSASGSTGKLTLFLAILFFLPMICPVLSPLKVAAGPSQTFPYGALETILKSSKHEITVAAIPDWGGFLTFFGKRRVFPILDDRNSLVGESFHKIYMDRLKNRDITFFQSLNADFLLIPAQPGLEKIISENRVVYSDKTALLISLQRQSMP